MRPILSLTLALACAGFFAASLGAEARTAAPVAPQPMKQAGTLTCTIQPGAGLLIASARAATCIFDHPGSDYFSDKYDARLSRFGLDVGVMSGQSIKWAVMTPGGHAYQGMLSGSHVGTSSEAALGMGVGAQTNFSGAGTAVMLEQMGSTMGVGLGLSFGETRLDLDIQDPLALAQ